MFKRVLEFVQQNRMIGSRDRIVVGVSGGADSVCLLLVLSEMRKLYDLNLFVVHVNHGLRAEEALRDQVFVENLCKELGVVCQVCQEDVAAYGKAKGYSLEEAGRILRYEAFEREYKKRDCNKIAIAHNKNDHAETVLFNLARGTGITGLTGIEPVRGHIIRPLLSVTREEIEAYLGERGRHYCVDSTNLIDIYTRNKVRLNIIPELNKINEQAVAHITNCAKQLSEIEDYLKKQTNQAYARIVTEKNGQYCVKVGDLSREELVVRKRVIRQMIFSLGNQLRNIEEKHILAVLGLCEKGVGKRVNLPYGILAVREYEEIRIGFVPDSKEASEPLGIKIDKMGNYHLSNLGIELEVELLDYKKNMIIPKNRYTKWFDYDKIKNTIFLRNRMQGDYLQINNKGNVKTIKALFIDEKVPKEQRDSIPLLCDGNHVMWVLGGRISEGYKITEQSRKILVVKMMEV